MVSSDFIELRDLNFFYKKNSFVLKSLNAKIHSGKITALLGINGSGKTTLFKILTGLCKQSSGSIFYNDILINTYTLSFYKTILGFMPEFLQLYKNMSVKDVLYFLAGLKGYENIDLNDLLKKVFLLEHSDKKVKNLSKGMKQRLNLAQAIIGSPKIVLFDEPSNGFDCGSITMFYSVLRNLADNGAIVLLSSHHLTEISGNVDNVLILSKGKIVKEFNIDLFNSNESFLFKEIFIIVDSLVNDSFLFLLNKKFPDIKVKNFNIFYGRANNKTIIDLVLFVLDFNLSIIDIRINNKILEDMLIELL